LSSNKSLLRNCNDEKVLGRMMIQCARQPGLAKVWSSVLGFDGAEFYIKVRTPPPNTCHSDLPRTR